MLLGYIAKRALKLIPLLLAISVVIFIIIQLPPGDYITNYIIQQQNSGLEVNQSSIISMTKRYGLDQPVYLQYFYWIKNIVTRGDFGQSMQWTQPVSQLLSERLPATILIALLTLCVTWGVSIPIGIYSATHQYSVGDYFIIFIGFIGLAVPGFLLAMCAVYFIFTHTGQSLTGLFSSAYVNAPWSVAKVVDMLPRLGLVVFIVGLSQTAGLVRQMRAMLLDELQKQYVITARAKGLEERRLLWKYPIRMAINPMISTIGWILPGLISGEMVVSIILSMPTMGPVVRRALIAQDMYLAGSFLLIVSVLTVVGTLLSDILLAVVDPRIRFGGVTE
ncbi:MAG: ABC transporter permease [Oscillospiraceae bacterium]|jgi:peptide/nickel transport system permease protein|nr:ABC transporter permease [Oscillospiraceae bacterium]